MTPSDEERPLSGLMPSMVGAAGAVLSIVTTKEAEAPPLLPAMSVPLAVRLAGVPKPFRGHGSAGLEQRQLLDQRTPGEHDLSHQRVRNRTAVLDEQHVFAVPYIHRPLRRARFERGHAGRDPWLGHGQVEQGHFLRRQDSFRAG